MRRRLLLAAVPLLLIAAFIAVFAVRSGQAQLQTQAVASTSIRTDKTQYRVGG